MVGVCPYRVFLWAKIDKTIVCKASIVSCLIARTWQFDRMSKWATMIFQMLSMRDTLTKAVSTSLLIANGLIWARISPSVVLRWFCCDENIGEWKFSSTPTVS